MIFGKIWPYMLHGCVIVTSNGLQEKMIEETDFSQDLFPFTALVIIDGVLGTGTIVAPKWVLTINQWQGKELKVRGLVKAGKRFLSTSVEEHEVYAQIRNVKQLYKLPFQDLIGSALLLLLEEPFVFDKAVEAALFTKTRVFLLAGVQANSTRGLLYLLGQLTERSLPKKALKRDSCRKLLSATERNIRPNKLSVLGTTLAKLEQAGQEDISWSEMVPEKDTCFVVGYGGEGNKSYAFLSGNDWPVHRCENSMGMEQLCSPFGVHGVACAGDYGAPAVCGNCVTGILRVPQGFRDCPLVDKYEFLFVPYILPWIKKLAPEVRIAECIQMPDFRMVNFSPKLTPNYCLVIISVFITVFDKYS